VILSDIHHDGASAHYKEPLAKLFSGKKAIHPRCINEPFFSGPVFRGV